MLKEKQFKGIDLLIHSFRAQTPLCPNWKNVDLHSMGVKLVYRSCETFLCIVLGTS